MRLEFRASAPTLGLLLYYEASEAGCQVGSLHPKASFVRAWPLSDSPVPSHSTGQLKLRATGEAQEALSSPRLELCFSLEKSRKGKRHAWDYPGCEARTGTKP